MPLTPAEIANSPPIILGGETFHIPALASKQNRVVMGGLKLLMPVLQDFERMANEAKSALDKAKANGGGNADDAKSVLSMLNDFPLETATFDVLCDVVYAACTRARPEFTRAEFDDLPLGVDELMQALPVIMGQAFSFSRRVGGAPAIPEASPVPVNPEPVPTPTPPPSPPST